MDRTRRHHGWTRGRNGAAWLAVVLSACGGATDVTEVGNRAPDLLNAPPASAEHNELWRYQPSTFDPDGDPVRLEIVTIPAWLTLDATTGALEGTPGWEAIGTHTLALRLSDGMADRVRTFALEITKGEIHCGEGWPATQAEALYVLPFPPGRDYNVSQSYCNPTNSHDLLHAYDIDTEIGDTLVASRAGLVRTVRDRFVDGNATAGEENWIWIEHEDGTVMNYVHIAQNGALVSVGQRVEQGQPIALSGNTGLTHRPHVHTALYRNAQDFSRQASIPIAYRNAEGRLDAVGGLRVNERYLALPDGT